MIRVFSIPEGLRLFEFRRGMKRYEAHQGLFFDRAGEKCRFTQMSPAGRVLTTLCVFITKGMSTSAPFPSARMLSFSVHQAIQRRSTFSSLNSTAQGSANSHNVSIWAVVILRNRLT